MVLKFWAARLGGEAFKVKVCEGSFLLRGKFIQVIRVFWLFLIEQELLTQNPGDGGLAREAFEIRAGGWRWRQGLGFELWSWIETSKNDTPFNVSGTRIMMGWIRVGWLSMSLKKKKREKIEWLPCARVEVGVPACARSRHKCGVLC